VSAPAATSSATSSATLRAVRGLLREAGAVYRDDAVAGDALRRQAERLDGPLRVAVAGKVKSGKSTLVNALIGEEVAPTDAGECTQVVTWYRDGPSPRAVVEALDGRAEQVPLHRVGGRLALGLGAVPAEQVDRLVVDWPAARLREMTIIDTPGTASLSRAVSARALAFLTPEDEPTEADAVLYLLRHLHATDVRFLEAFRGTGRGTAVNAVAVLSRADEVGAGRIDALISAQDVAQRYRQDPAVRSLCQTVVPVAGLLAQTAGTLRQAEFAAVRRLAATDRPALERQLLSADRFRTGTGADDALGTAVRDALLERFGLFGLRLSLALVRGGLDDPTALARELSRRSGLEELRRLLHVQFSRRSDQLKARTALAGLRHLLRERPPADAAARAALAAGLERVEAGAHDLRELRLLTDLRGPVALLPADAVADAERLLGAEGASPHERLGVPADAPADALRAHATDALVRWRRRAESPVTRRPAADASRVVVRSCEGVLAALAQGAVSGGAATRSPTAGAP